MEIAARANPTAGTGEQYSLARILGIWVLAALPMGILSWMVYPALAFGFEADPLGMGVIRLALLTAGLIWLFVLSMIIIRLEEGNLRWATVKRRLRLNPPLDPRTRASRRRLWLWAIPFLIAIVVYDVAIRSGVTRLWVSIFPMLAEPPGYSFDAIFKSPVILERLVGAWWFFGLVLVNQVFNTILGEELLFRGILLPKMEAVFGRWSWAANGVLHGLWHVHQPWGIAGSVIGSMFLYAFPSWRFRSTWLGIIVHSAQGVYFLFLILGVVLGLA